MKRLVSTCHTGSDTGVNRRPRQQGETWKHTGKHAAVRAVQKGKYSYQRPSITRSLGVHNAISTHTFD